MNVLISKYLRDKLSDSEKVEFNEWLSKDPHNQHSLDEAQLIWDQSYKLRKIYVPDTELAWYQLSNEISKGASIRSWSRYGWVGGFAASVLLIGMLFTLLKDQSTVHYAALTEVKSPIELPDGSIIWINQNSELSFEEDEMSRRATLQGEAYFEVVSNPNKPFIIQTGKLSTQVIGTSFNIDASEYGSIDVVVSTGKVLVFNEKDSVFLDPGEVGAYDLNTNTLIESHNTNQNFDAWKTGILIFEDTPIHEVVQILEAHFDSKLVLSNSADDVKLNGSFDNQSLDEILSVIELTTDVHIKKSNK